jgi:hypothetical protein
VDVAVLVQRSGEATPVPGSRKTIGSWRPGSLPPKRGRNLAHPLPFCHEWNRRRDYYDLMTRSSIVPGAPSGPPRRIIFFSRVRDRLLCVPAGTSRINTIPGQPPFRPQKASGCAGFAVRAASGKKLLLSRLPPIVGRSRSIAMEHGCTQGTGGIRCKPVHETVSPTPGNSGMRNFLR